jgi:uncharacterized glyoxalase superfamily protein PhnB
MTDIATLQEVYAMNTLIPILRIFDEAMARSFYLRYLGATETFSHRFDPTAPLYLGVQLHEADLHLSEHFGDATPGSSIRLRVADLTRYHAQITEAPHSNANPSINEQPWGLDMPISDPFGNRIIFCQY